MNAPDSSEVERKTRILEKKVPDGYEKFRTWRSDQVPKPNDEWFQKADRFVRGEQVGSARMQWCGLPRGEGVDMTVAGAENVRGRLIDGKMAMIDLDSGKELLRMPLTPSRISCLWVSQDRRRFAAGSQDGVIRLWDLRLADSPILSLRAHAEEIQIMTANESETALLSADVGGHVRGGR